jgi:acetylornithine deacetylase/succinyl-diaminopimelate desuccinylase-like protein
VNRARIVIAAVSISLLSLASPLFAQQAQPPDTPAAQIADELGTLASDAMQGRGSGTPDELRAATYLASELRQIGISPLGDHGDFIQDVSTTVNFRSGPRQWHTRNVIGVLAGSDAKFKDQVILLTAHLDHLGVGRPVNGDSIYNGADDDASGCVAVLQLARALAAGPRPKRTVLFVLFGSEETGGQGDQ